MGNVTGVLSRTKEFQSVAPDSLVIQKTNPRNRKHRTVVDPADTIPAFNRFQICPLVNLAKENSFDFNQTEGQIRRRRLADCEFECSQITSDIYVGGYYVAGHWDILKENNITRIVNCSAAVVENTFEDMSGMKYLSLNMVDGRQDDLFWFFPEVMQFLMEGRTCGQKTLIHCEKGVSRSCSYVIAFLMWTTGNQHTSYVHVHTYAQIRRHKDIPFTSPYIPLYTPFTSQLNATPPTPQAAHGNSPSTMSSCGGRFAGRTPRSHVTS